MKIRPVNHGFYMYNLRLLLLLFLILLFFLVVFFGCIHMQWMHMCVCLCFCNFKDEEKKEIKNGFGMLWMGFDRFNQDQYCVNNEEVTYFCVSIFEFFFLCNFVTFLLFLFCLWEWKKLKTINQMNLSNYCFVW